MATHYSAGGGGGADGPLQNGLGHRPSPTGITPGSPTVHCHEDGAATDCAHVVQVSAPRSPMCWSGLDRSAGLWAVGRSLLISKLSRPNGGGAWSPLSNPPPPLGSKGRLSFCICFMHISNLHNPPPPVVTFRRVAVSLRGPGQSPVLPFACCVGSLRSVGRCGRCSRWCRFRVRGAPSLVCRACAVCALAMPNY